MLGVARLAHNTTNTRFLCVMFLVCSKALIGLLDCAVVVSFKINDLQSLLCLLCSTCAVNFKVTTQPKLNKIVCC